MTGNARLDVNFGTSNVSGAFSERTSNTGSSFADVTLPASILAQGDGSFGGFTTTGRETSAGVLNATASGTYSGLIVGTDGGEAVGSLNIDHSQNGALRLREYGAFMAVAPPSP